MPATMSTRHALWGALTCPRPPAAPSGRLRTVARTVATAVATRPRYRAAAAELAFCGHHYRHARAMARHGWPATPGTAQRPAMPAARRCSTGCRAWPGGSGYGTIPLAR